MIGCKCSKLLVNESQYPIASDSSSPVPLLFDVFRNAFLFFEILLVLFGESKGSRSQNFFNHVLIHCFFLEQPLSQLTNHLFFLSHHHLRPFLARTHDLQNFSVNGVFNIPRILFGVLSFIVLEPAQALAESIMSYQCFGQLISLVEIVRSSR